MDVMDRVKMLRAHPEFVELAEALDDLIPEVPTWSPANPIPEVNHAYQSGHADGVRHFISILKGEFNE